jgi:hypothetical protein
LHVIQEDKLWFSQQYDRVKPFSGHVPSGESYEHMIQRRWR